jgi:DNA modification methylase
LDWIDVSEGRTRMELGVGIEGSNAMADNQTILVGDVREQLATVPAESVQCVVTSPPYWNLRDYGIPGQLGLEPTIEDYVANLVQVFEGVARVLRPDGTVWLNLGDTYATTGGRGLESGRLATVNRAWKQRNVRPDRQAGVAAKNLCGIPWRVALALQAMGWYLRQEIIWHKPSPMPSSAKDRFCTAHEPLFLLTKSPTYFFDWLAVTEPTSGTANSRGSGQSRKSRPLTRESGIKATSSWSGQVSGLVARRMRRTVWKIAPKGFKGAHFATFPPDLVRPCLLAGTSERGACTSCGAPWKRDVAKTRRPTRPGKDSKMNLASVEPGSPYKAHAGIIYGNRDPQRHVTDYETTGWRPTCRCGVDSTRPCVVLDPFCGSGTTLAVARELGLEGIGIDLNPDYAAMAEKRIGAVTPKG